MFTENYYLWSFSVTRVVYISPRYWTKPLKLSRMSKNELLMYMFQLSCLARTTFPALKGQLPPSRFFLKSPVLDHHSSNVGYLQLFKVVLNFYKLNVKIFAGSKIRCACVILGYHLIMGSRSVPTKSRIALAQVKEAPRTKERVWESTLCLQFLNHEKCSGYK